MTPLQKLIKQFEEIKDSNIESSIDVGFAISLAKSLLEKEKEVINDAYITGFVDRETYNEADDDYYNETFNTKEK